MAKEKTQYYDFNGLLTQKQARWYHKLDKCPKYFVSKHNHPIGGRLEIVGTPKVQVITDLMNTRYEGSYSDYYHKEGYGFGTFGGQGFERIYKKGRVCRADEFKRPAWRPFALFTDWSSEDYHYVLLQSWEEIFEWASDRDFTGTINVYKNPEQ